MIHYTGERAVPWNKATGPGVMHPHIMRYAWATQFAWAESVVDLGCGVGYGSYILSMVADSVLGVDVNSESIAYADMRFVAPNLDYERHNLLDGPPEGRPSLYVAFEVLEHLADPMLLVDDLDAPLVWSIPINVPNRWHIRTYGIDDIEAMMGGDIYYQSETGQIAKWRANLEDKTGYVLGVRP
jgi:trans-aconitate methyltransferase